MLPELPKKGERHWSDMYHALGAEKYIPINLFIFFFFGKPAIKLKNFDNCT
jgi:hypothetical protein